jgi:hypothetical protein
VLVMYVVGMVAGTYLADVEADQVLVRDQLLD